MTSKDSPRNEQGTALVFSLIFTTVVLGIVLTGTLTLRSQVVKNRTLFIANYQAVMTARSGLTEALSWLRRQTSQPVTAFEPQLDEAANPQILDTLDPDIGMVREFRISGNLWARYEVWKPWPTDPDADRLAWRNQFACSDVSEPRVGGAPGTAWHLRSLGYVYRRNDANVPFNQAPNAVLASELAETDVLRAVLNLPGQAAINVNDGNGAHINTNGRVVGGSGAGIYYPQGSGTPTVGSAKQNRVTGSPGLSPGTSYDDSYEAVFGLTLDELKAMANAVVTSEADFPVPIPDNGLVVIESSSFHFDATVPLMGTGIVIVSSNCNIDPGSNSLFSGLLYVDGNLTIRSPSEINGAVLCTGNLTVQGASDYATINFDEDALAAILSTFGNYRRANSVLLPRRSR
ncbi:MAG: hypothetical protein H6835_02095 [Planctomycetes bacterium]|nr:hypothetical protein [Planctomycetota bacterium]